MAVYGKTWWGQKWLETFNDIDDENRLPRGRDNSKMIVINMLKQKLSDSLIMQVTGLSKEELDRLKNKI